MKFMRTGWMCLLLFLVPGLAMAQGIPKALQGKIIANPEALDIPTSSGQLVKAMQSQHKKNFQKNKEGKWTIHFVAFFNKPVKGEALGIVVLNEKKEAMALANLTSTNGQQTLSSQIDVETTDSPGKPHLLQVYTTLDKKAVVLAKTEIVLKN